MRPESISLAGQQVATCESLVRPSLPSGSSAVALMGGDWSALPVAVGHTILRSVLVGSGLLVAGERTHVVRNAVAGSLAIEAFVLAWAAWKTRGASAGTKKPHLFVIGDSQACGMTGVANPCGSDPSRPCARSGETFTKVIDLDGTSALVYCKVGAHTSELSAIVPKLGIAPGDVVLIFLGSNDYDSKPDPTTIIKAIKAAGAKYLWVGPPSIRGKDGTAPPYLQSVLGNGYFDSQALGLKLTDGVHPGPDEFARWRAAVLGAVRQGRPA